MKWLKKNTGFKRANVHLVLRSQKKSYAKTKEEKPNVLIDDYAKNIKEWEAAGGIGILHTNVGKTINKLKGLGNTNEMAQILSQMMAFTENLEGIKSVLKKGLEK